MVHIYAHSVLNACIADSQSQNYTVQWYSRGDRRVRADTIQTYATTRNEWLTLPTPHNCSSPYLNYTVQPCAAPLKAARVTPHHCSSPYLNYTVPPYAAPLKAARVHSTPLCHCVRVFSGRAHRRRSLACHHPRRPSKPHTKTQDHDTCHRVRLHCSPIAAESCCAHPAGALMVRGLRAPAQYHLVIS